MGGLAVLATATSLSLATSCATSVQDRDDSTTHGAGGIVQPPTRVPTTTQSMPLSAAVSPATSQAMVGHHGRPNILLITVDDASVSDLRHMPSTQRLVVDRGTDFEDALAPTPMCAPSRASLLTGQYAHNHGVLTVEGEAGGAQAFAHEDNTLPVWLHEAGYYTMFLGKYLNGYGDDGDPVVEPGWDQWRPTMGQSTYEYLDPVLNINGHLSPRHQYVTDLISAQTHLLLARRQGKGRPWFMWVNYVAPHDGEPLEDGDAARSADGVPTPYVKREDRGRSASVPFPAGRNMFAPDPGRAGTAGGSRGPGWRRAVRNGYHQRLDSLLAVDDAVARTIRTLRHTRQLSRTIVVFTSDNGFMTGQHDQYGKLLFYDDSLRIPVAMAGPSIPRHHTVRSPITNPDLATTFAAIAGARPGRRQDGIDVRPLMHGGYRARPIPIEAYPVHGGTRPVYTGIRYANLTYVRLRHGVEELYDRTTDPYELVNVAHRPAYRSALTQMRRWRHLYRRCAGRGCRQQLQSWPAQTAVP